MATMFRIVSIVAALAVAHAGITDYSKQSVEDIFATGYVKVSSQLINPDVTIEFQKSGEENAIGFIAKKSSPSAQDTFCGSNLGVLINNEPHCVVTALTLKEVKKSGKTGLQLEVAFEVKPESEPVVVAVPILKIPSGSTSSQQWAADNDVALAPAEIENLSLVQDKQSITIGFEWLNKLLEKGVIKSIHESSAITINKLQIVCQPYHTQPVAVSSDIAQKLAEIIEG